MDLYKPRPKLEVIAMFVTFAQPYTRPVRIPHNVCITEHLFFLALSSRVENSFAFTLIAKWGKESRSNGREFRLYCQLNRIFLVVNESGLPFHPRKLRLIFQQHQNTADKFVLT